jgi:archaellum component FlaC
VASFGALIFSFLNYKRSKKFENENHIYKLKIEIYSKIIAELSKLLNELQKNVSLGIKFAKVKSEKNYTLLNQYADEIDKICFDFSDFIIDNSLIIPGKIIKSLQSFCDKVIGGDTIDADMNDIENEIKKAEKLVDELIYNAEAIGVLLRKDLHIDELNTSLYKRLKK